MQVGLYPTNFLLSIFNAEGQANQRMEWSGQKIILNTSEWISGVYLIEWKTEEGKLFKKVVK